ncbi:pectinesterase family protein [Niabella sp. CC-SYL272]|uniref:pectinesterase family protein n=1 Tax=Niabella agricola TaxID=2891571 RepID=UPI001F3316D2|nr:pectinesterase family protein [Niabella agricola]MCF3109695.1 pectinesterase family protein [Niabella agricola]
MRSSVIVKMKRILLMTLLFATACKKEQGGRATGLHELDKPGTLVAQPQSDKAIISWDPVSGADGYFVELCKGETFFAPAVIAASDTIAGSSYTFEGLTPSTSYALRLRAISRRFPSETSKSQIHTFMTMAPPVINKVADAVVAADGSGNYTTVQAAINAVPENGTNYYYIYIKKGTYKEVIEVGQNKPYIYLVGEDKTQTVLTYDNYSGRPKPGGGTYGTADSRSFYVKGNNFVADNITFANSAGMNAGQAVALYIDAASSAFINCRFLGYQDTWYAHNATRQYIKNCYIEGSVDFMFGGSKTLFDHCELYSNRTGGYVTAASTSAGQDYGYVFQNCRFTSATGISGVYLGRPWRPEAQVVLISCELGSHIRAEGWHNWSNPDNEKTAYYAEYKSTGPGANPAARVSWSHQLTDAETARYTFEKMFDNWDPGFLAENIRIVTK